MKRFHILAIAAFASFAVVAFASDCKADVVDLSYQPAAVHVMAPVSVDMPCVVADVFVPVFASNFNRLVVFPETGSPAMCDGTSAMVRGPPKSLIRWA
jgi:hypothetical protein